MATKSALGYNGYTLPIGVVISFLGKQAPDGFLVCDGAVYNKADYPQLFRVLDGIGYGQSANTFNVPNLVDYFLKGTDVNTNTVNAGTTGTMAVEFSIPEDCMPPFTTNSQNGITFNCNTDGHALITSNGGKDTVSGSPENQTFNNGNVITSHPAPSVNLSSVSSAYPAGTGSVQSIPLSSAPAPAHYLIQYCIRADYPNLP
jgi:microcystin-dependent protein